MWYTLSIPFLCQREVGPISIDSTSFPRVRSQRREGSSRCVSFFSEPPPLSCFFSLRLSQIRNLLSLFQLRFFTLRLSQIRNLLSLFQLRFFTLRLSQIRNLLSLFQLRFFNYVSLPSTFLRYVIVSLSSNYVRSLSLFQLTLSPPSIIITKPFPRLTHTVAFRIVYCVWQNLNCILCLENRIKTNLFHFRKRFFLPSII